MGSKVVEAEQKNILVINYLYLKTDELKMIDSYHFRIAEGSDLQELKELKIVVEGHELWDVYVNGQPLEIEEGSWWIDHEFHVFLERAELAVQLPESQLHLNLRNYRSRQ